MSTLSPNQDFISTLAVLQGVKDSLAAMALPEPYSALGKVFEDVRIYAHRNLAQALQDLLIVSDRVALIIPTGFSHQNETDGRNLTSRRTMEFAVLIADRVYGGTANEAALGGKDNPGMILLAELAIGALTGLDLDLPAMVIQPSRGEPLLLGGKDNNEQTFAREAWAQTFSIPAGERRVDRGRPRPLGPVSRPVPDNSGN